MLSLAESQVALSMIFWVGVVSFGLGVGMAFLEEWPCTWCKLLIQWGVLASVAAGVLLLAIALD